MTYLSHSSCQVIWPDLRSNFQTDRSGSKCTCFDASCREEYDGVSRFSLSSLVQQLFAKSLSSQKRNIFFTCPGKVKMYPKVVKLGIIRFTTPRSFRLSLMRSSISIRGQTSRGHPPPQVCSRMAKWQVRARVTPFDGNQRIVAFKSPFNKNPSDHLQNFN